MTDAATPSDDLQAESEPSEGQSYTGGVGERGPGRIRRIQSRIEVGRGQVDDAYQRLEDSRSRVRTVDVAFALHEGDRDSGGSLLAGALAFRLFLWLLPAALLIVAGLGFDSAAGANDPNDAVRNAGITSIPAQSINQAAGESQSARWVALILGIFFLYTTSVSLMKALSVAHALIWHVPAPKLAHRLRAAGTLLATALAIGAVSSLEAVIRNHSAGYGLLALIAGTLCYSAAWWALSIQLPHSDASALDLLPGAVLFGIGLEALRVLAVYYLAAKFTSASLLYGSLGAAAALLLGLYLAGRIIVAAAVLNAALWSRKGAEAESPGGSPGPSD
jgi:uncharacterized BrkB/YihY/UPF0761 family membrane protein